MILLCNQMSQTSRLPRTIVTKNHATDFTSTFENVEVDRQNKRDRVFHNKLRKKYFSSEDQLKYVVESLVLDNGYLMDSERGKKIVFKHPKNYSTYTFDLDELSGEYQEKKLVATLD